ncbi:MAG: SRPBCC family protein [Dehalococcoidia bacterium]|nr:SRPBCC family protein [Dehalococcoidia bacterium]
MPIDARAGITIQCSRPQVAQFLFDPANDHRWIGGVSQPAERLDEGAFGEGSQVRRAAKFLGRTLDYTMTITAYEPEKRLVMETESGMPMTTTYFLQDAGDGATRVTIRNQGGPGGLLGYFKHVFGFLLNRRVHRDLARLQRILEGAGPTV